MVGTAEPFHNTVELAANPEPFTVRVNDPPPATAVAGLRLLITGEAPAAGVIVKDRPFEEVPFVFTVIVGEPAAAMRLAATDAIN